MVSHLIQLECLTLPDQKTTATSSDLFPFGRGALDEQRRVAISANCLIQRWLQLSTQCFARSKTAVGLFFDITSRSKALACATLTLPPSSFSKIANVTALQFSEALRYEASRRKALRTLTLPPPVTKNEGMLSALELLQQAEFASSSMVNTPKQRLGFRKQAFALQSIFGNPSFFLTLNPYDTNSLVIS
eukprot:GHVS01075477.1.p2 GENE.GHVS01075477.1~~GHVS01075477.1.p2  ORF type:complete len:189 (+),score=11.22 GHVS01075477.1:272-838(+)